MSQTVNVVSIKAHIPIVLDLKSSNYTKWWTFFATMHGKFGLLHHIDGSTPPRPQDAIWAQQDFIILTW